MFAKLWFAYNKAKQGESHEFQRSLIWIPYGISKYLWKVGMRNQGLVLFFQPSQPLLCILYLSNTRISVFPEQEEFLVKFDGFPFPAFLLI